MGDSNQLLRLTAAAYADGLSEMRSGVDPIAVSQTVFDQSKDMPNSLGISSLFASWGQFVDHDLSLTPDESGELVFVPGLVAPFDRSIFDTSTGTNVPREQTNVVAPLMDGSMIYGSDAIREAELRLFSDGKLTMPDPGLLKLTESGMAGASAANPLFLSGDVRANENTGLTLLHTLFSREHNTWAERLKAKHSDWSDEMLFQAARSIVEYEIQKITYEDWLPHLVGNAVGTDTGFNPSAIGQVATEFSTAAFRFGHTLISSEIKQMEENGARSIQGNILVRDAFFNIGQIEKYGLDDLLRGLSMGSAQELDTQVVDDLNFFLASPTGTAGFSLPALNILRGRDHGVGTYIDVRADLLGDINPTSLDPFDFSIITNDKAVQVKLASVYHTVDKVDLWVGGLAEKAIGGTLLGPLFSHIISDQFARTRAADNSFNQLDPRIDVSIRSELADVGLNDIIARNTGITHLQQDVFVAANRLGGDERNEVLVGDEMNDLLMGFAGRDFIYGREGDDALYGGEGNDQLRGNQGEDVLFGEAGNDWLYGNTESDVLDGGTGNDTLEGGHGADRFVFSAGSGRDVIADFGRGRDQIVLDGLGVSNIGDVFAIARGVGSDTFIQFGSDTLIIENMSPVGLMVDDFLFA